MYEYCAIDVKLRRHKNNFKKLPLVHLGELYLKGSHVNELLPTIHKTVRLLQLATSIPEICKNFIQTLHRIEDLVSNSIVLIDEKCYCSLPRRNNK